MAPPWLLRRLRRLARPSPLEGDGDGCAARVKGAAAPPQPFGGDGVVGPVRVKGAAVEKVPPSGGTAEGGTSVWRAAQVKGAAVPPQPVGQLPHRGSGPEGSQKPKAKSQKPGQRPELNAP